jgi:hypothetical protein
VQGTNPKRTVGLRVSPISKPAFTGCLKRRASTIRAEVGDDRQLLDALLIVGALQAL